MSPDANTVEQDDTLELTGALDVTTASAILKKTRKFIADKPVTIIDFSKVEYADSTALALILHWQRQALQQHTKITFKNIPQQLVQIAKLSELDKIILTETKIIVSLA